MAEKARLYDPDRDSESPLSEKATRTSGIRIKSDKKVVEDIEDHISLFRMKRLRAGILNEGDKMYSPRYECFRKQNEEAGLSEDMYESRMKELIEKVCGKKYLDFLESGHPLARFWVQLKIGIEVMPKSEYMYYLQSVLDMPVDEMETFGTSKMKDVFMDKFGFLSDEEVEEYMEAILNECDVENVIGVE